MRGGSEMVKMRGGSEVVKMRGGSEAVKGMRGWVGEDEGKK